MEGKVSLKLIFVVLDHDETINTITKKDKFNAKNFLASGEIFSYSLGTF